MFHLRTVSGTKFDFGEWLLQYIYVRALGECEGVILGITMSGESSTGYGLGGKASGGDDDL